MLTLIMPKDMDETVEPDPADFVLLIDDVQKVPDLIHWTTIRNLVLDYSEVTLGPTEVFLRFSAKTDQFLTLLGELVTPFDILVTPP